MKTLVINFDHITMEIIDIVTLKIDTDRIIRINGNDIYIKNITIGSGIVFIDQYKVQFGERRLIISTKDKGIIYDFTF